MDHKRIKLIVNPSAGRGGVKKRVVYTIEQALKRMGVEFSISYTEAHGMARDLAASAVEKGFGLIVACGGDGTVNEVLNGMVDSDAVLGIIPCGRGNDLALSLGIPRRVERACMLLREGYVSLIDIGRINGRYFANSVGIGFDGHVAWEAQRVRSYLCGILCAMARYRPQEASLELNGMRFRDRFMLIAIGNGKSAGGGYYLTPDAELNDGLLDLCAIEDIPSWRLLINLPRALRGTHIELPYVRYYKTERIDVVCKNPILAHVDGEVIQETAYRIEVLPRRLRVLTGYRLEEIEVS